MEIETTPEELEEELEDEHFSFNDLEAHDHASLSQIVLLVSRLVNDRDSYCAEGLAADAWGKSVDLSSKMATRWSFSGALSKAATDLFDPPDEKLEKDLKSKYDFRVKKARKILNLRRWRARRYYGYAWGLFSYSALVVADKELHQRIDHDTAQKIVEFARRELFEAIGVDDGNIILGMARRTDMKSIAEIELLEKIDEAGMEGYRLPDGNVRELLASYDLYRRGVIIETEAPWTYRRKHVKFASV